MKRVSPRLHVHAIGGGNGNSCPNTSHFFTRWYIATARMTLPDRSASVGSATNKCDYNDVIIRDKHSHTTSPPTSPTHVHVQHEQYDSDVTVPDDVVRGWWEACGQLVANERDHGRGPKPRRSTACTYHHSIRPFTYPTETRTNWYSHEQKPPHILGVCANMGLHKRFRHILVLQNVCDSSWNRVRDSVQN